ncbi:MAG TPA: hypothetical protein VGB25_10480 [Candidatus Binatia bacterium]
MEPVEELAQLLSEHKRLDEKLEETQATLSGVRKEISRTMALSSLKLGNGPVSLDEGLVRKEQTFERLLQALLDMKTEVEGKIRPLEEEIIQANVRNLLDIHASQISRLENCLNAIDQALVDCRPHVANSKKLFDDLNLLNEKLARFGAEALPISSSVGGGEIEKVLRERIERLRLQGKV